MKVLTTIQHMDNADIKQKLFLAKSTSGQDEANHLF